MGRQSAFPGIFVDEIKVETRPYDKEGVVQEFVGRGLIKEFETLQRAEEFSPDVVSDFIDSAEERVGPLSDDFRLKYNLKVRAFPSGDSPNMKLASKLQQRSISTRARIFVRAKNPFEPEVLEVGTPREDPELSGGEIGDVYDVTVTVTK